MGNVQGSRVVAMIVVVAVVIVAVASVVVIVVAGGWMSGYCVIDRTNQEAPAGVR